MTVPPKRSPRSRIRRRRSHHRLSAIEVAVCQKCKEPIQPHRACANCGEYKGRKVLRVEAAVEKALRKKSKKHDHEHDHGHEHATENKTESKAPSA
ncbi:MAG: hypothetical protein ACD_76C00006G0005 [uncultured bacterium]|nr:MAG: hypothetical protein ACD_76C00006G0005 [uncultured bacterium]HBD05470.1 50S ribosomal protein L32 [Candidatus Uhrbacteria bacterium]